MYTFNTWRDPYNMGFSPCSKRKVTIEQGITVLVGCNGAGKTTLINNIKECIGKEHIPCYSFDNLNEGGAYAREKAVSAGDLEFCATAWCSSEGENITLNLSRMIQNIKDFIKTGETPKSRRNKRLAKVFRGNDIKDETNPCNKRFIIMDAVDSGYSIDNIVDLKTVLHSIVSYAEKCHTELYIILSANEYELAADENCLDITNGNYLRFDDYKSFKSFILKSRKKKDTRIEKAIAKKNNNDKCTLAENEDNKGDDEHE